MMVIPMVDVAAWFAWCMPKLLPARLRPARRLLRRLLLGRRASRRLIDRLSQPLDDMMQLLFQDSTEGILVVDATGMIVRGNDRLREMLDARIVASPGVDALMIFAPVHRDDVQEALAPLRAGRPGSVVLTTRLDGGSDQSVDVRAAALREADGTVSGMILRLSDITVQKQLETQLAQSQKLQAMGQLAGGIAHDFNNLLTAVIGAADLVLTRPGTDADTLEDAAQIRRSADRGAELVSQLLAFGRQQTLQPKAVAINNAIRDLALLLRRLIDGRVKLVLDLDAAERMVRVDPTQLDQVLLNLAVNARDAMPDGGTLTLRSGHMTLYRALIRGEETIAPGHYVMIEVQDTGVGIPPEVLPRIFDPFFTTRRERGGTGLGLSTVHGIVRQSDGFLAIDSDAGKGTKLRVYLPRHEPGDHMAIPRLTTPLAGAPLPVALAQPSVETPAAAALPVERLTALLVEDEPAVRRLARRAMAQAGWNVLEADCAETALTLLAARDEAGDVPALSLLISDVMMPGMDGPTLVTKVRKAFPNVPTILVSGYAREVLSRDPVLENITFLPKPYTLKSLVAHAETVMRQHAVTLAGTTTGAPPNAPASTSPGVANVGAPGD